MTVTQGVLAQIVAQGSSLSERLNHEFFKVDAVQVSEQQLIDKRLTHWCQVVAQGNWEKFQKRLHWDGLDINAIRPVLGVLPVADGQVLPSWAETLREIIQTASEPIFQDESKIQHLKSKGLIDPEEPLPFEDVMLPVLWMARQKLLTYLGSVSLFSSQLLCEKAYLALERNLLAQLVHLCAKTLEFEFSHFRPLGYKCLYLLVNAAPDTADKTYYNAFVQKLLQDGLLAFFQNYPVLARWIATSIDFWVEATAEFLQRLEADLSEIEQTFICQNQHTETKVVSNCSLGKVIEIKPGLSDSHNRGRSGIAITFESGLKLVYKPKDLGLEAFYGQFLTWCNQHGIPLPLKVLNVLDRQDYGWVEYVEQLPCEDEAAARRFYQRAGMLLCILYVLGGTDCHNENLIASGEHLVLVDMETLMHHEARVMEDMWLATVTETASDRQFWHSVLRTGLLPRWNFSKDDRIAYDISGLGNIAPQQIPWRVPLWKSVNTDDMHLTYKTIAMPVDKNVPILNGQPLSPNDYLEELVEGFQQMYRFLCNQREVLLADNSPLTQLQAQRLRFVFRDTKIYSVILQKALAPKFLRDGIDYSIELDVLARAFLTDGDKPTAWPILHSELRAMEQLDIPYFGANSDSDTLTIGVLEPIEQYFKEPSDRSVISRFQQLDEADLAQQVAIIRGTFHARVARTPGTEQATAVDASTLLAADFSPISPLSTQQLLEQASRIAWEIQERAIRATDSSINWIGLGYLSNADRFQLQPLGESLYDGSCGVALFLAALDYLRDSTEFHDLALGALASLRKVLQTPDASSTRRFTREVGIGGAAGLGSIIYSLVKISQFLQKPALLAEAEQAARTISPELIAADRQLDLMTGAAGAILGLLALYHETAEPMLIEKAIACGQHLLEHRNSVNGSPRAWKALEKKPLTGFSHGAAGIAYALLRLYAVTQDNGYLEAAKEGIAYERQVFSPSANNWPDFRSFAEQNGQPGFMVGWCHGAPGIGLARLGGLPILETEEIYQDVAMALQTTHKSSWQGVDHLCCGNFGRIEVLLVASQKLSQPQLREIAQQQAAWVVARAKQTGAYQLFANLPNSVFSPSFFQGTAGIGYELLRLAYPEVLPSVLLWE